MNYILFMNCYNNKKLPYIYSSNCLINIQASRSE